MDQTPETIEADLHSQDRTRVHSALKQLEAGMDAGLRTAIAPLGIQIFEGLGDEVPEDMQLDLFTLLQRYKWFDPPMTPADRATAMVAVVLRYGGSFVAYDAALKVAVTSDPSPGVEAAMNAIRAHGLESTRSVAGVKSFVSRLLERKQPVREVTVRKLSTWPKDGGFLQVIEYIRPELEPAELQVLDSET